MYKRGLILFLLVSLSTCLTTITGFGNHNSSIVFQKTTAPATVQTEPSPKGQPEKLSAADFSKLIQDLSEEGGYFRSDNLTSNETPYLHIVDTLKRLGATGGAYIGVGPEQNFTYIAKIRPRIAFIIDIRRQAIVQHLMYKAIFHMSPTRAQFLSMLFSRPLPKDKKFAADAPIKDLLTAIGQTPVDEKAYAANLATIRRVIKEDFKFPLTDQDQDGLEYIYKNFHDQGLDISYQMGQFRSSMFPSLADLVVETDLNGKLGNYLASKDDYDYVRDMHSRNMIIPIVGNFAGPKALGAIGDYLKKNNYTVTAYYLSNVEQYLFMDGIFGAFANNVKKLPITDKSLLIRSVSGRMSMHPARQAGHRSVTLLEQISVFIKDFDEGKYPTYMDLTTTHYIAPDPVQSSPVKNQQ